MTNLVVHLDNAEPNEVEALTKAVRDSADICVGDVVTVGNEQYRITRIDVRLKDAD